MKCYDEMEELGFADGKTMVAYGTLEELAEKLKWYAREPQTLRDIGHNALELVRKRHTWEHRAKQIEELIRMGAERPTG